MFVLFHSDPSQKNDSKTIKTFADHQRVGVWFTKSWLFGAHGWRECGRSLGLDRRSGRRVKPLVLECFLNH